MMIVVDNCMADNIPEYENVMAHIRTELRGGAVFWLIHRLLQQRKWSFYNTFLSEMFTCDKFEHLANYSSQRSF